MKGRIQETKEKVIAEKKKRIDIVENKRQKIIDTKIETILKVIEAASAKGESSVDYNRQDWTDVEAINAIAHVFSVMTHTQECYMTNNDVLSH